MKSINCQDWLKSEKEKKELRIKWTAPFLLHASLPFTYKKKGGLWVEELP